MMRAARALSVSSVVSEAPGGIPPGAFFSRRTAAPVLASPRGVVHVGDTAARNRVRLHDPTRLQRRPAFPAGGALRGSDRQRACTRAAEVREQR